MRNLRWVYILIAIIFSVDFIQANTLPTAVNGMIDLRNVDLKSVTPLNGEWQFYWQQYKTDYQCSLPTTNSEPRIQVPSKWNDQVVDNQTLSGHGWGSYRLYILAPLTDQALALKFLYVSTAYRLYANGKLIATTGTFGTTAATSKPEFRPIRVILPEGDTCAGFAPNERLIVLDIEMSNFHHARGGLWNSVDIGTFDAIESEYSTNAFREILLCGALLVLALYHLVFYILRRTEKAALYFAIFCILLGLRASVTGEVTLSSFVELPYQVIIRLQYLTYFLAAPAFMFFIREIFPNEIKLRVVQAVLLVALGFSSLCFFSANLFSGLVNYYHLIVLVVVIYSLTCIIIAKFKKRQNASLFLISFLVFFATIAHDILQNMFFNTGVYLSSYGLMMFSFFQAIVLARRFAGAITSNEQLAENLQDTNKAFARFVPIEALNFMDQKNIGQVTTGQSRVGHFTILFVDIRGFTTVSENKTPSEILRALNGFLHLMTPIIHRYGGYVDKYIGDAIMAIFPGDAEAATQAALKMKERISSTPKRLKVLGFEQLQTAAAIHYGDVLIGTVGTSKRLNVTALSDAVNVTSRLETLAKRYNTWIMMSEEAFESLPDRNIFKYRRMGRTKVRGREQEFAVYEILEETDNDMAFSLSTVKE